MSNTAMTQSESSASSSYMKWGLALLVILLVGAAYYYLPISDWLASFQNWVQGFGPLGWLIFILVYAITSFFLVPGSILTVGAGVAYGLWAFPLVIVGATLGSAISFLAARYVFQERVQNKIDEYPKFKAINAAISEEGGKVVFLLRLSPALPFSLQNWFLGLTSVGFLQSQVATLFGIMPGTLLYVWISSLGGEAAAGGTDASLLRYIGLAVGLIATIAVTIIVTRKAQQKLKQFSVQ